jgi:hypothetical protein
MNLDTIVLFRFGVAQRPGQPSPASTALQNSVTLEHALTIAKTSRRGGPNPTISAARNSRSRKSKRSKSNEVLKLLNRLVGNFYLRHQIICSPRGFRMSQGPG